MKQDYQAPMMSDVPGIPYCTRKQFYSKSTREWNQEYNAGLAIGHARSQRVGIRSLPSILRVYIE